MKKLFIPLVLLFCISVANADMKEAVTKECKELGFKEGTQELAKCKLELLVLNKQMKLEEKKLEAAEASAEAAVASWGGIAGTFPIAIVGGVIGYLAVKAFSDKDKKKK